MCRSTPGPAEAIRCAVSEPCLAEWVRARPDGHDTLAGEDGAQLSGGQRLALA